MKKLALVAALALSACVYPQDEMTSPDLPPPLSNQLDTPRLAMLEHVLAGYFAADIVDPPTVCATVHDGREDIALPPAEEAALMERFTQLAPFSRCTWANDRWEDHETGEPALVFNVHSFTCASAQQCSGWAGYRSSEATSMSYLYRGEWDDGAWRFTQDPRLIAE